MHHKNDTLALYVTNYSALGEHGERFSVSLFSYLTLDLPGVSNDIDDNEIAWL